jgi:hypothetical protein
VVDREITGGARRAPNPYRNEMEFFKVPSHKMVFAILGDNPIRDLEYGLPEPVFSPSRKDQSGYYPIHLAYDVLWAIENVAEAQQMGCDPETMKEAKLVLSWVRKQRTKLKARGIEDVN